MKSLYFVLFFSFFLTCLKSQELTGVVKDSTHKGVPYVNIGIPAKAFGVITDENGNFKLRITTETETDTVLITSIGYYPLMMSVSDFKKRCLEYLPFLLTEEVQQLSTVSIRPNDYETKVLGTTHVADLECADLSELRRKDSASIRRYREKGMSEKSAGIEIGNKISIKKGQQTFIDRIQFKTCLGEHDTAIYRINIYSPGKTLNRVLSPVGMVKIVSSNNTLKEPIIVKTTGKAEVHDIDVSKQNIEVADDFIISLECIYASNSKMSIGAAPSLFGSTDLMIRESIMDEWIKIPAVNLIFISATVMQKAKSRK